MRVSVRVYLAEISSPRSKLLGALCENMPPSKALWQAVATVALPSFIFWSIAAIVLRETFDSDALLLYLILFALPPPLIYPIYRRYRKGAQFGGVARSPRYHRTALGRTCSKSIPSCDQGGNALTLSRRPPPPALC